MIEPNKEGDVKILAKDRTTNKTCSTVELKVVTPVFAINLALNATDAKRGVAAETVFGNKIFNADCTETSPYSFYMDFNYPKDVDFENFEFSTSDESIAKFSDEKGSYNKLVLNDKMPDEKKGLKNKVTITIKAKYPMYDNMPVVATYVLNVIDGYTVSNETQLKKALHEKKKALRFTSRIRLPAANLKFVRTTIRTRPESPCRKARACTATALSYATTNRI